MKKPALEVDFRRCVRPSLRRGAFAGSGGPRDALAKTLTEQGAAAHMSALLDVVKTLADGRGCRTGRRRAARFQTYPRMRQQKPSHNKGLPHMPMLLRGAGRKALSRLGAAEFGPGRAIVLQLELAFSWSTAHKQKFQAHFAVWAPFRASSKEAPRKALKGVWEQSGHATIGLARPELVASGRRELPAKPQKQAGKGQLRSRNLSCQDSDNWLFFSILHVFPLFWLSGGTPRPASLPGLSREVPRHVLAKILGFRVSTFTPPRHGGDSRLHDALCRSRSSGSFGLRVAVVEPSAKTLGLRV